jgi:replicative DNA helicase
MRDNKRLEKVLLGKLMANKEHYFDNHTLLQPELFTQQETRTLYMAVEAQYIENGQCDLVKLMQANKTISAELIAECNSISWEAFIPRQIILMLSEATKKEQIINLCSNIVARAKDNDDIFEIIEEAQSKMGKIADVSSGELTTIDKQFHQMMKKIEENANSDGITGVPSGYSDIDKFTGGWQQQDLVIIGGASSMGKTSLAMNMALNAAKYRKPTVIFSYEMGVNQLLTRIVSSETEIDNKHILRGKLFKEEHEKVYQTIGNIEKLPLYIDECSNTSLSYLLNRIRQFAIVKKIELVIVDYLQLVSNNIKGRSREQEVSQVARALKNIAKELNVSIIALSQLSRAIGKRDGNRPTLADLRESGEIEQASDTVMLVYRPEYYGILTDQYNRSTNGLAEIIFAKGRNIGIGSKYLKFINYITKFVDENTYDSKVESLQS